MENPSHHYILIILLCLCFLQSTSPYAFCSTLLPDFLKLISLLVLSLYCMISFDESLILRYVFISSFMFSCISIYSYHVSLDQGLNFFLVGTKWYFTIAFYS